MNAFGWLVAPSRRPRSKAHTRQPGLRGADGVALSLRTTHTLRKTSPPETTRTALCVVRPSSWPPMADAGTNKASFHAAGAPDAPALRLLAAMARESSSRVEKMSRGVRISRHVSRASRTGLSSGPSEWPPPSEIDRLRYHGCCRCRWQLLGSFRRAHALLSAWWCGCRCAMESHCEGRLGRRALLYRRWIDAVICLK